MSNKFLNEEVLFDFLVNDIKVMNESEVNALLEEEKTVMLKDIILNILNNIKSQINNVDTIVADKSKGDIKKIKELADLKEAITKIEVIIERATNQNNVTIVKKYLSEIIECVIHINEYSKVFREAYASKKILMILKYQSIILSLFSAVAYIFSEILSFDNDDIELKSSFNLEEITPLKNIIQFNNSVRSGEFESATNSISQLRESFNENDNDTMISLVEAADIVNVTIDGIKNFIKNINAGNKITDFVYKFAGVLATLLSIREIVFSLLNMKTKMNSVISAVSSFANMNNIGGNILSKLSSFANKFVVDSENATERAAVDIVDQNKELKNDIIMAAKTSNQNQEESSDDDPIW